MGPQGPMGRRSLIFTGKLHKSSDRQPIKGVQDTMKFLSDNTRRQPKPEFLYLHPNDSGDGKMTQLMDKNEDAKNNNENNGSE